MNQAIENNDFSVVGLSVEQERLVLRRYIIYSLFIILLYALLTGRNYLQTSNPIALYSLIWSLVFMAICASYFFIKNHLIGKNFITIFFSLTLVLSFFSYNGINGFFTIDYINLLIFTFILYNTKSLIRYGIFFFIMFGGLIALQLTDVVPVQH